MTETTTKTKRPAGRKTNPATAILAEVKAERKAVEAEPIPLAGGQRPTKAKVHYQREANRWRSVETSRRLAERPGWDASLLAALYGALAEAEPKNARSGLVRLAALAVAAVEDIDRETT
ncbi:hypothetical protein [Streptomyces sp. NPDC006134]|uniref:hypothetical protein n=1 Tax=Streptomyces sp. NPDC006134 TaxID=3154467 RepID=UPI0033EEA97F